MWFTSMFSSKTSDDGLISAGTLNSTKITSLVAVLVAAVGSVWTGVTGDGGPLADMTTGQKLTLWLAVGGFVAVLVVTDMIVRAYVTAQVAATAHVIKLEPPKAVTYQPEKNPSAAHVHGELVAISIDGEGNWSYCVHPDNDADVTWVDSAEFVR